jgi:class 3 adenylate cyclase
MGVVAIGHRRKLLQAIEALRTGSGGGPGPGMAARAGSPAVQQEPVAERRHLTVMFCDLVGSTALAARLDPEDMSEVLKSYQDAVAGEVQRWEGHVAKFMGDGVLAYFGWPKAHEDDAERAVRAGLAVTKTVTALKTPAHTALAARIGVATGLVVVGDLIGRGAAQEEAVVGETPNLAARLQALAAPGAVLVADATCRLVGGLFDSQDLGTHALKGFSEPVRAWRVIAAGRVAGRFEALRGASPAPLVGREQELAVLLDHWQQVKKGKGQAVMLNGEAGIGKSRIVFALCERLSVEPHTHLPISAPHTIRTLRCGRSSNSLSEQWGWRATTPLRQA